MLSQIFLASVIMTSTGLCTETANKVTKMDTVTVNRIADAIFLHENSKKFPYGCEHRVNGHLVGYSEPIARQKCIALCERVYSTWHRQGDYFRALNKIYAADPNWWRDVESKYNKTTKGAK